MKSLIFFQAACGAAALGLVIFLTPPDVPEARDNPAAAVVSEGREVSIEYTLWLDETTALETNVGEEPMKYIQGSGQLVPGLEKALEGMRVGQRKHVTVPTEEAYGPRREDALREVGRDQVPADSLEPGTVLNGRDAQGRMFVVTVHEVKKDTVVLDMNHPLAGKTLYFSVRVLAVGDPPDKGALPADGER